MSYLRIAGVFDRLGIVKRIKLSPEQATSRQMQQLVRASIAEGNCALVLMFHSSSLLPGASPYVRSADDLERFYQSLRDIFGFVRDVLKLETSTLGGWGSRPTV
jgi:hypothetical protein